MFGLALRNLLVRKTRTALALLGLTVAILGVIAIISASSGVRSLISETLSSVPGLTVLQKGVLSLGFSTLPVTVSAEIERVPGVHVAMGQVWFPAFEVEGENAVTNADPFNAFLVLGVDVGNGKRSREKGPMRAGMLEGRDLRDGEREAVIPRLAADRYKKKLGDQLEILGRKFTIVGIFRTGQIFFDHCLVVPLADARAIAGKGPSLVSSFYVEPDPGADVEKLGAAIERDVAGVHVLTADSLSKETGKIWLRVNLLLGAIASIAVVVGAVGIVNTMLMSVIERTAELGVLRATGWTRADVVRLVVIESAALGVLGGALGCAVGAAFVLTVGASMDLRMAAPLWLLLASFGGSLLLGVLGGIYPAWRASRLDPIEAIRS